MSAVDKLGALADVLARARDPRDAGPGLAVAQALGTAATRLIAFARAFKTWRESECTTQGTARDFDDHPCCVGDNHLIDCPVEVARQDAIATFDKLEGLQL